MHLFTGSPLALKNHFLKTIKNLKQNPFDRVLVLIPSKHLETRLKTELCRDLSCLAGVNFMSLGALAREINQAAKNPPPPLAETSPLLDFQVRHLLKENGFNNNRNLAICFRNSFRDLINAEVEPETLLAIQEDEEIVLEEQRAYLRQFVPMYEKFLEIQKVPGKSTYKAFFTAARNNAADNTFLNSFKQIIFYGFYDLTSLHYELIKTIIENYEDTQVYFPYEKDNPAYKFAEPLFKSCFLPLAKDGPVKCTSKENENNLIKTAAENIFKPEQKPARGANIEIMRISGEGEVQAAAKKILQLHKNGIAYSDIALTFRAESGFNKHILEVFKQNRIPLNCNFSFPFLEKPFAAFIYNLFNLGRGNFAREDVTAVLNSPYFAFRQDSWLNLIQQSGAECSINQFEEMLSEDNPQEKQALIDILKEIKAHISMLEKDGQFADLAQKAKDFIAKYTSKQAQTEQAEILAKINEILTNIAAYSATGQTANKGEFLEEFFALLKEATFNYVLSAPEAVIAADIMTLRLQDFKAVIILGLNGGILPLVPQPDPALKEVYRQSLSKPIRKTLQEIGYLIHTTQNRYLEENLLFYFALSSAQQKAILTYKTTNETGETMVKSIYITLLLSVLGKKEEDLKGLSRRPAERLRKDIKQEFLTKEEAAVLIALTKPSAKELLCEILAGNDKNTFEEEYNALKALSSQDGLTDFDGILEETDAAKIYPKAFSPSSLKEIYNCPLKYFFSRITDTEQDIFHRGKLDYNIQGTIYHNILWRFYQSLTGKVNFLEITWPDMENRFNIFLEDEFKRPEYKKYGLYPLLLENIKQEIKETLLIFLEKDLKDIQKTGFCPVMFETSKSAELNVKGKTMTVKAKIDRIDNKPGSKEMRAVDYKKSYKTTKMPFTIYKNGELQPPLYLAISEGQKDEIYTGASLTFIENDTNKHSDTLTLDTFNATKDRFEELLSFLHELILQGTFPLRENDNCKDCSYKDICRKYHLQTVKRARKSKYVKELRKYHDFKG